jgi:hypothetical protein
MMKENFKEAIIHIFKMKIVTRTQRMMDRFHQTIISVFWSEITYMSSMYILINQIVIDLITLQWTQVLLIVLNLIIED